ncbi:DNA repair protein RecO [Ovoidimarina sediminis]|uniref:DNA repair protein RecO n=1 Tax=Ovoidimarina sediminis TaxID=3079856 RepID=UPI00290820E0|nr:DNA repair protein RecO [Rhodophyticola sp. MJ-SS7]MDU8943912.1 DNA repair protein RecO [Rhodophyticola sp. MJ-SS7]
MEWRGEGVLLSVRKHGETAAIIEIFAPGQGRYAGVVRGGVSRKMTPILQPGAQLDVTWRARLDEHIGAFTVEPVKARAAQVFGDRLALAGMTSALALLSFALPEREAHDPLYEKTGGLMDLIGVNPVWPLAYLRWELALLDELGFGLDLSRCAVTGALEDLAYVSPKSGRAVSRAGAGEWEDRLLPLPPALLGEGEGALPEVAAGLRTTGHFLSARVAAALGDRPLPEARRRFADLIARQG